MSQLAEDVEVESREETTEDESSLGEPFDISLVAKALVLFGLVTLVIYLVMRYLAVTTFADDSWMVRTVLQPGAFEGIVAVTCIFIFFGAIAYLIHIQFMKLAMIAEEVMASEGSEGILEEERLDFNLEDGS